MRAKVSGLTRISALALIVFGTFPCGVAQVLDQGCVVSILNRNTQVNSNGTWAILNVPANLGQVRARISCTQNGVTLEGGSAFFTVPVNGLVTIPPINFEEIPSIPASLMITTPTNLIATQGDTAQLAVISTSATGDQIDLTGATSGTNYTTSNPAVATVSPDGLVTAVSSGTTIISAMNEGALGVIAINVVLGGASNGGIPDSWAIAHGLDPNDPAMPFEDPDHDGLNNLQEFQHGTDPHNPDTDGDGLPDGLEIALGGDPLNPNDFLSLLPRALKSIQVSPSAFTINFNTLLGEGARQLIVTGTLIDLNVTQIDLTSARRGTNYTSSDLTVCNFGAFDGQVFAGNSGTCTITVSNSGFTAQATGIIKTFSPAPLSFVSIPGFANNVKVNGNFAYVAAGSAGLQVVDVSDRTNPRIVASLATPGNANDLRVVGDRVYLAAGSAGLVIIDVTNPLTPTFLGSSKTPDVAWDVAVAGNLAFIAAGSSGLQIATVSDPSNPTLISSTSGTASCSIGTAKGVAVSSNFALVAAGSGGLQVVDISNPSNPQILGCVGMPSGDARKVQAKGTAAFVAPYPDSLQVVDFSAPGSPRIVGTTSFTLGGRLQDVAISSVLGETLTLGADVFFVNGVPITDVTVPTNPVSRAIIDFRQFRDDNGHGIAADSAFVYMTGEEGSISDIGVTGDTRLYIGQYLALEDTDGIPPTALIASPTAGTIVIERQTIPVTVLATDDVAVASVSLTLKGQVIGTQTSPPYQFNFQVPVGVSTVTLGAFAVDLAGDVGRALPVQLNVIPDPGTTVVGKVVDVAGNPVAGATVSTFGGRSAVTGVDGSFSITQVPTVLGNIVVTATFTDVDGTFRKGDSAPTPPVPLGITTINSCAATPSALVSWWPGDGNSIDLADGNNGVLQNGAAFAPGLVGEAFSLDGLNAFVDVGNAPNLQVSSGSFTALTWVNFNALQGDMSILDKMSSAGVNLDGWRLIKQSDNRFWFCLGGRTGNRCFDPAYTVFSRTAPTTGTWYHVAVVKSAADFSIYVNGVLQDTRTLPSSPAFLDTNSTDLLLGSYALQGAHLNGSIDEAQVYNRVLSATEIQSIFAAGGHGNCKGGPLDHAIVILPVPTITRMSRKSALAGAQVTISVTGTTLSASTFTFSPASSPAIAVQSASIDSTGTSASLAVSVPSSIAGTFALVATNVAGSSDTTITPTNRFTVVDPKSRADSDGDGVPDVFEAVFGTDPLDPNSIPLLPSAVGQTQSVAVTVLNRSSGTPTPMTFEAESAGVTVLNTNVGPKTHEAESPAVVVLNSNPSSTPRSFEAESPAVTVLNNNSGPVVHEVESPAVVVLNANPLSTPQNFEAESPIVTILNGTFGPTIHETESPAVSIRNTATSAAIHPVPVTIQARMRRQNALAQGIKTQNRAGTTLKRKSARRASTKSHKPTGNRTISTGHQPGTNSAASPISAKSTMELK